MPDDIVRDLREQVRVLSLENQQLTDRAEDIFLLGTIGEKVGSANDPDLLLNSTLEEIALLKDIPLCLFGSLDEQQLTITHCYSTLADFPDLTQPVATPRPALFSSLDEPSTVTDSENALALLRLLFPASSLTFHSVFCSSRHRIDGTTSILMLADHRQLQAFEPLEPLLSRVMDMVMARLDRLLLQNSLKVANQGLEQKVLERTNELTRVNQALQAEISERKRAEEESSKLNEKMQQVQKLESLGVLAGGIAHDFNNILMVILGHAELAKMTLPPTTPIRDNLLAIEQAAQRAAALSRQMLAYSGRGKFVIETLNLGELVKDMVHMLEVSISKKALLRFNFAPALPPVKVDATQIRQVIMNLVINASEAIGDRSGIIAISTGAMMVDRSYLRDVWFDENLGEGLYVFIEVADTGCGMDHETMKRVFDPFFTTKFTGRGLGMAAVLGIVRGHEGSMKLYSEPGKGTTFKVLLPVAANYTEHLRQTVKVDMPITGSGTILLVDDEETLLALGQEMLGILGYQVITATDGCQALEKFKAHRDTITAVLLDLTMPHMDGEETFRELRRIMPEVRVIMTSGYNEQEVSQRFIGKGISGFVQKPYTVTELATILQAKVVPPRPQGSES